jgi:hypothetical protein
MGAMSLIHNEQIKLLASAVDRTSTACFTIGIVTPIAGFVYNVSGFRSTIGAAELTAGLLGWLAAAALLHLGARRILKGLEP